MRKRKRVPSEQEQNSMDDGQPVKHTLKSVLTPLKDVLWNLLLISIGSVLCAVAVNGILVPLHFLSGGFTGVALIIHYLAPFLPLGTLYFLLNVPLFVLGWKFVGSRFFFYSIAGMLIYSVAVQFIKVAFPLQDKLLSALLAGIISGVGSGIILKSRGSAGGTDILSVILLKLFSFRLGNTALGFNIVILGTAVTLFPLEKTLYTLIYIYVSSHILNLVVTGLSQRKAVLIISPQWERISRDIMYGIRRGVTISTAKGGYSGKEMEVLYAVISFREWPRLKRVIRDADPNAFVVVTDTLEVMGHGIGNQPPW
jgi:uncharacterized membrane-anchored protein YitT (DUF2179 family)